MRYYVVSDVHVYYTQMKSALEKAGFFSDDTPHKLIMLGDIFDRGHEAKQVQQFVLEQMEQDRVILIRGNHEDLFVELVTVDGGLPYSHHKSNGTYDTALQLTGFDPVMASIRNYDFADAAKNTPFYKKIIPAISITLKRSTMFLLMHGSRAFRTGIRATAILLRGERLMKPIGRRQDGSMGSMLHRPLTKRRQSSADTGIPHMGIGNTKIRGASSGMTLTSHRTTGRA